MTTKGRRAAAALVLGGLAVATVWGLWLVRPVLAPFFLAIVIAYLVAPLVNALSGRGLSRGWAIAVVFGLLGALIGLAVVKFVPQFMREAHRLMDAIPAYTEQTLTAIDGLKGRLQEMGMPPAMQEALVRMITEAEHASVRTLDRMVNLGALRQVAGFLLSLLLAPFLAVYLLKDMERFKERFIATIPQRSRAQVVGLLRGLDAVLAGFVRGQVLLGLAVGGLAGVAVHLIGLRYAILLGVWAGLTEFIPYVGPVLGMIPSVVAGLTVSPLTALEVVLAFLAIQQLENAVLSPKIMGESVGLHPLTVMLSVLAGGYLFGPWGMIVSLPAVALLRVVWCFLIDRLTDVAPSQRAGGT